MLDCEDGCPHDAAKMAMGLCGCGMANMDKIPITMVSQIVKMGAVKVLPRWLLVYVDVAKADTNLHGCQG